MEDKINIFGCFVKICFNPDNKEGASFDSQTFRSYIWGDSGIDIKLKRLSYEDYGKDLKLILLQFYVKPMQLELKNLKEIESYRKKEKAIGVPIVITEDNFFNKKEKDRRDFLKKIILDKMNVLEDVVKKRKLDTNMSNLKLDLEHILS